MKETMNCHNCKYNYIDTEYSNLVCASCTFDTAHNGIDGMSEYWVNVNQGNESEGE